MDQSDAKDLAELNQTLNQTLGHVDATSIANHAIYNGVIFWLILGTIIIVTIYFRHKGRIERTRLLQTFVEKGLPIPPELLSEPRAKANPIARGIMLTSSGLATILFLWSMTSGVFGEKDPDTWLPFLGVFPLFIGIAYLAIGLYQRRHG
jgi:hypothetical protein